MQWTDDAFVLSARRYGEGGAVVHLLTQGHGRHAGLVRGAGARQGRGVVQPGNRVHTTWMARLEEQLGIMSLELSIAHAAMAMDDPDRLAVLASACAVADVALPEREPHPHLFEAFEALLADFSGGDFASSYVRWELVLLAELGYGLDLSRCAVTGASEDLAWVSPKSGRAVSAAAGAAYAARLLPLPGFLVHGGSGDASAVLAGLALTGHFLERFVLAPHGRPLPPARTRLVDRMAR